MKKVIAGKVYDTEKAHKLGAHAFEKATPTDPDYCTEALYQKRTGEFFLHGEGGCNSRYAAPSSQYVWSAGEKIIPLTYEAAKDWAQEHLPTHEYDAIFRFVAEGDEYTDLHCQIDSSVMARVRQAAARDGLTISVWVETALKEALH